MENNKKSKSEEYELQRAERLRRQKDIWEKFNQTPLIDDTYGTWKTYTDTEKFAYFIYYETPFEPANEENQCVIHPMGDNKSRFIKKFRTAKIWNNDLKQWFTLIVLTKFNEYDAPVIAVWTQLAKQNKDLSEIKENHTELEIKKWS